MKYFYDTEFLEGTQKRRIGNIVLPKRFDLCPTIDLISIGIACEDGREYYAISKDFNLKEAWNRYDKVKFEDTKQYSKIYWIRENVLKPIFIELFILDLGMNYNAIKENNGLSVIANKMTYSWLKELIRKHGKSNKEIADEVKWFVAKGNHINCKSGLLENDITKETVSFYGYYSAYDHVALCWLFGKMIELPKGFPMYTIDLKQIIDEYLKKNKITVRSKNDGFSERNYFIGDNYSTTFTDMLNHLKNDPKYPKQANEHNALDDARWNRELYNFIQTL